MKDHPVAVRFSARIRERTTKAEELARAATFIWRSRNRKCKGAGRGQYSGAKNTPPTKEQKVMQQKTEVTKGTKEPEVDTEGLGQKNTVSQGLLDDDMTACDIQHTGDTIIVSLSTSIYPHDQGQQEGPCCPNWRSHTPSPISSPELDQYSQQFGELYQDPDGFFWLT